PSPNLQLNQEGICPIHVAIVLRRHCFCFLQSVVVAACFLFATPCYVSAMRSAILLRRVP
ncbi:MAG TPA: hypothetical protein VGC82_03045, partial [Rhodopila sp.]